LVRTCPNLEQLGISVEWDMMNVFALLLPFMRKLRALRILNELSSTEMQSLVDAMATEDAASQLGCDPTSMNNMVLRYVGLNDRVLEIEPSTAFSDVVGNGEKSAAWRGVKWSSSSAVQHLAIWKMDTLEL
jgi:hypothetical protein